MNWVDLRGLNTLSPVDASVPVRCVPLPEETEVLLAASDGLVPLPTLRVPVRLLLAERVLALLPLPRLLPTDVLALLALATLLALLLAALALADLVSVVRAALSESLILTGFDSSPPPSSSS
jgi:hypothetical protein